MEAFERQLIRVDAVVVRLSLSHMNESSGKVDVAAVHGLPRQYIAVLLNDASE